MLKAYINLYGIRSMVWDTIDKIHLLWQRMCFDAVKTYEQNLEEHRRKVKEEGKDGEYKKLL